MKRMDSYAQSIAGAGAIPYGTFKDETAPSAGDGTTVLANQLQDITYAIYQVLQHANVTPNGSLEDGTTVKQFISSLAVVTNLKWNQWATYLAGNLAWEISTTTIKVYVCKLGNTNQALSNATYWDQVYEITSAGVVNFLSLQKNGVDVQTIAVEAGTIAHGGIIPLPSGFTQAQCTWFVSSNYINNFDSIGGSNDWAKGHQYMSCSVTAGRSVTCKVSFSGSGSPDQINGTANYWIIGLK